MACELACASPFRRHDKEVEVPVTIAREGDLFPVRRPDRRTLVRGLRGQLDGIPSVDRDFIYVPLVAKRDLRPVRRDLRVAQP